MDKVIHVLVVDDEKIIRNSLEFFLEDEGLEVYSAQCAGEAMDIMANHPVQVGIFDMRMPDMDGNSLIMKIHKQYPHMKFIVYTGSTDYVLPAVMSDIGVTMDDVFIKPLADMSVLVRKILNKLGLE